MPKDAKQKQLHMRARIAAVAARIMAQDGVDDFGMAKRKAARQLGAKDTHALPGNDEVEFALRSYQSLYQGEEQDSRILELRRQALEAMRLLAQFRPYLCGPVLKGTAGRYGDIDLQLFTDEGKAVELLLLNRAIPYEVTLQRHFNGDLERTVAVLKFDWDGTAVNAAVYCANDERGAIRPTAGGRPIERAGIDAVEQLIGADA